MASRRGYKKERPGPGTHPGAGAILYSPEPANPQVRDFGQGLGRAFPQCLCVSIPERSGVDGRPASSQTTFPASRTLWSEMSRHQHSKTDVVVTIMVG